MHPKEKQILEAGFIQFLKFGFKRTSIDDIANAAGVGKGTVYNYFDNKENLFIRVANHNQEQIEKELARQWERYDGKEDPLIVFFVLQFRVLKKNFNQYNITLETFQELVEIYREQQGEKIDLKVQRLLELLIQGVKDGRYQPADHRKQAEVLFELGMQYTLKWIRMEDHEMERQIRDTYNLFLQGILN